MTAPRTGSATADRTSPDPSGHLLEVEHLCLGVRHGRSTLSLVDDVSFTVDPGERLGLVGESGSGKSMTLRAVQGVLPTGVEITSGAIRYDGEDLTTMSARRRSAVAGAGIAMIFQEPMTALNPTARVGDQIAEGPRLHRGLGRREAAELAVDMMRRTGIPDPARRARAFPHELSGGLRQRVMIAMALACSPRIVLCDEPTTALDVTVQDQVLSLLSGLCDEMGVALVFVTHDLAVVARTCRRLAVMYAGRVVETGSVRDVFAAPRHPYTLGLLRSAPDFDDPHREMVAIPGTPPVLTDLPPGCPFAPRCSFVHDDCRTTRVELAPVAPGRASACLHQDELAGVAVASTGGEARDHV